MLRVKIREELDTLRKSIKDKNIFKIFDESDVKLPE